MQLLFPVLIISVLTIGTEQVCPHQLYDIYICISLYQTCQSLTMGHPVSTSVLFTHI